MSASARRALPLLALCAACFSSSPVAPTGRAPSDAEVAAFSARIETFYRALEGVPLDALVTYESGDLRDCFESTAAFSDYFSALATAARMAYFRDGAARSVRIREFRFEGPDQASVDVEFRSVHQRALRFWSIGFERHDVWKLADGIWRIVPAKL